MKRLLNTTNIFFLTLLATMALTLSACGDDNDPAPRTSVASLSIRTAATGDDDSADPAGNDIINTWFMAFVDNSNKVAKIISRPASNTAPVEEEWVDFEIARGTYTVYAFANIDEETLADETGISLAEGAIVDPAALASAKWASSLNDWSDDKLIPMSGKQTVNVTGKDNESFSIEVVRMVGKVEMQFSNESQKTISVERVKFYNVAEGPLTFFPNYATLGKKPTFADAVTPAEIDHTLAEPLALGAFTHPELVKSHTFYVRESVAEGLHPTGHFVVAVGVSRNGVADEEQLYSLTNSLGWINRNDHVIIPIRFIDWVLRFDINFYPPIGGYPALTLEEKDSEQYATFGTQGRFVITPMLRKADSNDYIPVSQLNPTLELAADSDPIFTTVPTRDPLSGEITGELNATEGRAELKLTLTVQQPTSNDGTTTVARIYERKIYIIRKNRS